MRKLCPMFAAVVFVTLFCWTEVIAQQSVTKPRKQPRGVGQTLLGPHKAPGESRSRSQPNTEQNLAVRSAQIALRLAELNLEAALAANRKVANTIAASEILRLREEVKLARQNLEKFSSGRAPDTERQAAEANLRLAVDSYRKALAANRSAPGSVSDSDVERLRLMVEQNRLNVARQRAAVDDPKSALAEIHAELEQLREEVEQLRAQVDAMTNK